MLGLLEGDAVYKWCPYRDKKDCDIFDNIGAVDDERCCITTDCAMWRWDNMETETGYCGLGGKP